MILTHLVMFGFVDGASVGGGSPTPSATPRERIRQGVGIGFCLLFGLFITASKG